MQGAPVCSARLPGPGGSQAAGCLQARCCKGRAKAAWVTENRWLTGRLGCVSSQRSSSFCCRDRPSTHAARCAVGGRACTLSSSATESRSSPAVKAAVGKGVVHVARRADAAAPASADSSRSTAQGSACRVSSCSCFSDIPQSGTGKGRRRPARSLAGRRRKAGCQDAVSKPQFAADHNSRAEQERGRLVAGVESSLRTMRLAGMYTAYAGPMGCARRRNAQSQERQGGWMRRRRWRTARWPPLQVLKSSVAVAHKERPEQASDG